MKAYGVVDVQIHILLTSALAICLSVCLSINQSINLSIYLFVCLSIALQSFCWTLDSCSGSQSYTVSRTPWTEDQPVARPLPTHRITKTRNKGKQTFMPWVGFELTIPVFELASQQIMPQTARPLWSATLHISIPKYYKLSENSHDTLK
jgi:hypothetical protein